MISFLDDCWCCRCPNIFRLFFRSKPFLSISYLGVQYLYQILSVSISTFPRIFFDLLHGGIRRIPGHSSTKGGYTVYRIPNKWHFTVTQLIKYDNVCFLKWGDPKIFWLIHTYIYRINGKTNGLGYPYFGKPPNDVDPLDLEVLAIYQGSGSEGESSALLLLAKTKQVKSVGEGGISIYRRI